MSRGSSCRRLYLENLQHLTRSGCRRLVETGRWRNVWHHSLCPWKPHKDGGGWSPFRGKRPQKSDAEGRWAQASRVGEVQPSEHHRVDLRVTTGMAQRRHRAGLRIYPSNGLALMRRGRVMERFIPLQTVERDLLGAYPVEIYCIPHITQQSSLTPCTFLWEGRRSCEVMAARRCSWPPRNRIRALPARAIWIAGGRLLLCVMCTRRRHTHTLSHTHTHTRAHPHESKPVPHSASG